MTRRAALARTPERLWVVWEPERWWFPVPWEGAGIVVALCLLVPGVTELLTRTGRRAGSFLMVVALVAGFVWAVLSAWLILKWRQQRRRRRTGRERPDDWMCAACLHAEART